MRRSIVASLLILLLVIASQSLASAATPRRVLEGRFDRGLAMALDDHGNRHIVATHRNGDLWYATDRTGAWTTSRILGAKRGSDAWTKPAIATDDDGRVHVVAVRDLVYDTPSATRGIFYTTDKGRPRGDFSRPVRIARRMADQPSLRIDGNVLALAFATRPTGLDEDDAAVIFKTDRGGRWHVERVAGHGWSPALRLDATGRARIVFTDGRGLLHAEARTRVGRFSSPRRVPGTLGLPGRSWLGLDGAGRQHIAWVSGPIEPAIRYVERTARGWTAPKQLAFMAIHAAVSMDASFRPHVAIGGQRIVHRTLVGGKWTRSVLAPGVLPEGIDIRAYGTGATIAWAQDAPSRGVWVVRD
jgi:hypothetical protein